MSACECSPCGRSFTGLTAFDKHQDIDYKRTPPVRCIDPAELGMKQNDAGRWGFPSDASTRPPHWKMRAEQPPAGVSGRKHGGPGFMGGPGPDLGDDPDGDNS